MKVTDVSCTLLRLACSVSGLLGLAHSSSLSRRMASLDGFFDLTHALCPPKRTGPLPPE
jgi:hypothetical protein